MFKDIKASRRPANECLLSKEEYSSKLAKIIEDHNAEPQEGKRLNGLSPQEAWKTLQGDKPRHGFSAAFRYVLARDVRKVKVGRNGITLRYGKKPFVYRSEETGVRRGEHVLAWFDPMLPDVLACTDLDYKDVFSVPLSREVPSVDAPEDLLREEITKIDGHQAYAKNLFWTSQNTLKAHDYMVTIADPGTVRIGKEMAEQSQRIVAEREERQARGRNNRALIEKKNLPRELLPAAESMSADTVKALGNFMNDTTTEE